MDAVNLHTRLLPGISQSLKGNELSFVPVPGSPHEGFDVQLTVMPETMALWKNKGELWKWKDLHDAATGVLVSRDLKEIELVLNQRHLTLTEIPGTNLFIQEKSLTFSFNDSWKGFSRDLIITPDKIHGWWLEVPGALASLWSDDGATLLNITQGENLSPELQRKFASLGFGGVPELPVVSSFDWLWLDSVRFMDRLGPLAKKGDATSGVTPEEGYEIPERKSFRGHQTCRLVTVGELTTLATSVFRETGKVHSEWYGSVSRLRGPSGGGAFELELWALVNECAGLEKGLYRFSGSKKIFEAQPDKGHSELWLNRAQDAWGKKFGRPQVVLAVAGDLRKLPKKYQRLSLQVSMLNGGVRLSELLSEGEEQGLSLCALGGGVLRELGETRNLHPLIYGVLSEVAVGGPSE